jgi:2-C-methyl-D-erythritol 4-phosphate cytidylyltransferase
VEGGETRAESVHAGVVEVADDAVVIAVHDAARPLLPEEVLERVLTALNEGWDGAVPALALADTVKRVQDGRIVETLPREELVAVQTPQAFLAPVLREAFSGELAGATDCASLVEAKGGRVTTVAGDSRLLKVTDAADLELVASLL